MRKLITVRVNGVTETHEVESHRTLLEFLRDDLNLTGTKEGCSEGECGACMVLVGGRAVNSCLVLAIEAHDCDVTTIEGLSDGARLHPLQRAFLAHGAVQCGFCTPGMIVTAVALLNDNPDPTEADVRRALSGCLCRCTGYRQIIDAVLDAAADLRAANPREHGREAQTHAEPRRLPASPRVQGPRPTVNGDRPAEVTE